MPPVWTHSALRFRWRCVSPFLSSHHRMLWCLLLWFRCCLGICLFLSLSIAVPNSSVVISGILIISFWCCFLCTSMLLSSSVLPISCSVSSCSLSSYTFCVEFPKDVGNTLFETWWFPLSRFFILVMSTLLLCRFDSLDVLCTFEVFKYSLDVLLSFHSFFVSDIF